MPPPAPIPPIPTVPFTKPALTVAQQIAKMAGRGMAIPDPAAAAKTLERLGYYRLSAYALPWRRPGTTDYAPGADFDEVVRHYEFDRTLRNLVWEAIEPVEVAIRTRITLHLSLAYGPFAHAEPQRFRPTVWHPLRPPVWDHAKWLAKVEDEAGRSNEVFVRHFRSKYSGFPRLPLWMATEIMSFGSLSKMYGGMFAKDQRAIANGIGQSENWLPSWLHTISVIRNTCAHHSRLWDRGLGVKPALPQQAIWQTPANPHQDRLGCVVLILNELLRSTGAPCHRALIGRIRAHIGTMAPAWSVRMGLPSNWDTHPIWALT